MEKQGIPCLKSELDLFTDSAVQLAIDSSSFVEIHPLASLTDKTPLEFLISGNGEHYLDLAHTLLHLKFKIKKENGGSLAEGDDVAPINYILNTMFSECAIFLNDKQIASQVNYSYRAIIESLLLTSKSTQDNLLSAGMFYKDTAGEHDSITANSANTGYKKRSELCKLSKEVGLIGGLHFDLATQPKLLINGVNVRIKLERHKDNFALMSATNNFVIEIQSASLYVRKISVSPSVLIGHEKALEKGVIKMPIRRVEVRTFSLPNGLHSSTIPNAFIGQLPSRIILGLVSNTSFNGSSNKNPFKFRHYNLSYLCVLNDGRMIPAKPYQPNYDNNLYARSYMSLFTDLNRYHTSPNINISFEEYKQGYTLYSIDLTPDLAASESHASVNKSGNIAIDLKFDTALPETVNLIVYAEFKNLIELDRARNIFIDF